MKGIVGVGVSSKVIATTTTTTAKGAGVCAAPKTTVVNVGMADFSFSGVPASVPCGMVTFNETNTGVEDHNLDVVGHAPPGPVIPAGGSAFFSVTLDPGSYGYQCDVGNHAAQGMVGSLVVTA